MLKRIIGSVKEVGSKIKRMATMAVAALTVVVTKATQAKAATGDMVFTDPTMPDSTSIFQKMINTFGTAGTIGIAVIGAAVALGILIILGMWGWRLAKKWLSAAK